MNKVRESIEELKQAIRDTVDETKKGKTVMSRMYRRVKGSVKVATKGFKVKSVLFHLSLHSTLTYVLLGMRLGA